MTSRSDVPALRFRIEPRTIPNPNPDDPQDIDTATIANIGMRVGDALNTRSLNLETFQGVEEATVDLYSAVRNGYLQRRARAILE